jgi:hypothetical protein
MKLIASAAIATVLALAACSAAGPESVGSTSEAITHSDGFGHSWTDTVPVATRSVEEAVSACVAFVSSIGGTPNNCVIVPQCQAGNDAVVTYGPTPAKDIWGWVYAGPLVGSTVHDVSTWNGNVPLVEAVTLCWVQGATLPDGTTRAPMVAAGSWQ